MTGCEACDAWTDRTVPALRPGEHAARDCAECGQTIVIRNERGVPMLKRPLARDRSTDRVGEVMDRTGENGRLYHLRPVGGGYEWTAPAEHVELLDRDSAAVEADR